jgi:hypothetical protein
VELKLFLCTVKCRTDQCLSLEGQLLSYRSLNLKLRNTAYSIEARFIYIANKDRTHK